MDMMRHYHTYEDLLKLIEQSGKNYNLKIIEDAYDLAKRAHEGQKRVSGVDYIYHPVSLHSDKNLIGYYAYAVLSSEFGR